MTPRGAFITFEGGEGSGKSTQIVRLATRLRAAGIEPLLTREPGGTPLAEGVRDLLLDPAGAPDPVAEALLMEAARADLVARLLRPALAEGRVILSDRYDDSTLAYQGAGRGLDTAMLEQLNRIATGGLRPDLTLLYDLDPALGLARRTGSGRDLNRLDREPHGFHERVRACFLDLARAAPDRFVVLDATLPEATLEQRAWDEIEARLRAAGILGTGLSKS